MGVVPAGGLGHVSGHAEAALHEGAGTHRQILRGVPAGSAVRGGGSQTAAAVVRPAAQQELHREHVMCMCSRDVSLPHLSEVSTVWERSGFPLKSRLTLNCLFTKHICAFLLDPNISARKSRHTLTGGPSLPPLPSHVTLNL